MAINMMPAIDQRTCGAWNESDINMYQHLDHYLDKAQVEMKKVFPTFSKIVMKKRKWQANKGNLLRVVKTNPSPDLRQFAFPRPITSGRPNVDITNVTESYAEALPCSHQFESPHFSFLPDFTDFMSHVEHHRKDLMEKIELFNEKYLRGMMFHMCPYAFVVKANGTVALILPPYWTGNAEFVNTAAGDGKNQNFIAALMAGAVADITGEIAVPGGPLGVNAIEGAMTIAESDLGIPFFSGSELPKDDQPLDGKFLLIMDSETWNRLIYDPFVQGNRPLNFDIVTNGYKGSFFGRATSRIENRPLRYTSTGVAHPPQRRVENPGNFNDGETEPNPDFTRIAGAVGSCSPLGVAWLIGKNEYESLEVGPPPENFTGDSFPDAPAMNWNGDVRLTKNFLIPCTDADGNVFWQANTYGKHIKFISEATFGIVPTQRRNCIPIFYLRQRGA